jgi:hypothetical protein
MSLAGAVGVLAKQASMSAARRQLAAEGRRLSSVSYRELLILGRDYLAEHPELYAEAAKVVERWRSKGR